MPWRRPHAHVPQGAFRQRPVNGALRAKKPPSALAKIRIGRRLAQACVLPGNLSRVTLRSSLFSRASWFFTGILPECRQRGISISLLQEFGYYLLLRRLREKIYPIEWTGKKAALRPQDLPMAVQAWGGRLAEDKARPRQSRPRRGELRRNAGALA